ncbi:alpha-glucan family phosphorylase [Gloeobacter morelensis]|uniref:glycogen phosphorylase n=1 Tax=Gloeobacter morelensis MG652769 TaxID=2781736 RepID=A0ABY3PL39_9CYAN|nr:alpha-glucan family phosphorylase [Gloeobacter morelensis]UFP94375.1 alpha-glucan family phosphorylase [Gloeobacter morelensis MG652769]
MNTEVSSKVLQVRTLLRELITNYLWVWQDRLQQVFEALPTYKGHPNVAVAELSPAQSEALSDDPLFMARLRQAVDFQREYLAAAGERRIAYFSAEFGVHETLPIYSGGLGVLAGDHVKSASDLNLPLVAVGLMYRQGYFNQQLSPEGWQIERYVDQVMDLTCMSLVRDGDGNPLQITIPIEDRQVYARAWLAQVGRTPLYLLDTNVEQNGEIDRWITGHLYGGDQDTRIKQEVLLGIGGVRLLDALGLDIDIFHMNEGHAAFLTLELIRQRMQAGSNYVLARAEIAHACVFTTHTPVPAGHDAFSHELLLKVLEPYRHDELGISQFDLLVLGGRGRFSMTELALNLSGTANAVALRHQEVSQRMFPYRQITHVTNGIHHLTWASPEVTRLLDAAIPGWREDPTLLSEADNLDGEALRAAHAQAKARLVQFINERAHGVDFEEGLLTIGFARRFATYKRGDLIVRAIDKLPPEVGDRIQLVFAGKSHPRDNGGKEYIQKIHDLMEERRIRLVFVENYDMSVARKLVAGVDIWMNTPRRPLEASGTSGMKASLNGIPNLSVLDGWWVEGYNGKNGWAVGEDYVDGIEDEDEFDAASIAQLLSEQILDEFYNRPADWTVRMKAAVATAAFFNTHRMVSQYAEMIYRLPALVEV